MHISNQLNFNLMCNFLCGLFSNEEDQAKNQMKISHMRILLQRQQTAFTRYYTQRTQMLERQRCFLYFRAAFALARFFTEGFK